MLKNFIYIIKNSIKTRFDIIQMAFGVFMLRFGIVTKTGKILKDMRNNVTTLPNGDTIIKNVQNGLLDFQVEEGCKVGIIEFNDSSNQNNKSRFILICKDGLWHELVYTNNGKAVIFANIDECMKILTEDEIKRFKGLLEYLSPMLLV